MFDFDDVADLFLQNIKKLFFPEEWFELDLKFSKLELFTMLLVDKRKETTMTELVEYINTPMSTATGIVDRLVRNGYISRGRSETDRRIVLLSLTEEGSHFIDRLKELIMGYVNSAVEDLTEEEKQFLIHVIIKIMNNLQNKLNVKTPDNTEENTVKKIDIE